MDAPGDLYQCHFCEGPGESRDVRLHCSEECKLMKKVDSERAASYVSHRSMMFRR